MKKSYVHVQIDGKWTLVPKGQYVSERKGPYIIPDIQPYKPMAGEEAEAFIKNPEKARMIEGRKQHREYLRRNNLIEVGNEKAEFFKYQGKTRDNPWIKLKHRL